MKKRKVWRYTCDFCKKSNCSGGAIAKHELHCTKNPNRVCRMCARVGDKQATMDQLISAISYGVISKAETIDLLGEITTIPEMGEHKIDALRIVSHNCPACILSAIRQVSIPTEHIYCSSGNFDWKTERKEWIEDYHEASPIDMSSSPVFDRELWDERRKERLTTKLIF